MQRGRFCLEQLGDTESHVYVDCLKSNQRFVVFLFSSENNFEGAVVVWVREQMELNIVSSHGCSCSVAICAGLLYLVFTASLYVSTVFSDFSICCCIPLSSRAFWEAFSLNPCSNLKHDTVT